MENDCHQSFNQNKRRGREDVNSYVNIYASAQTPQNYALEQLM